MSTAGTIQEVGFNINEAVFLPCYRHLLYDAHEYDVDFLYGGRDSGKSYHIAMQLVLECLRAKQGAFRCLLVRKVANDIKDSQWQLIHDVVEKWGLSQFFKFTGNPLKITGPNDNTFICRGLDEPSRLKSVANPTHCWCEEGNEMESDDFVIILTTLRHNKVRVKTWFSFNPECKENYTDFWLYQEYFSHTTDLSWVHIKEIEIPERAAMRFLNDPRLIKRDDGTYAVNMYLRATHTTYLDNPYCPPTRVARYEGYKTQKNNQYWYQTYTLGLWGYRRSGGAYWKCFDEIKHIDTVRYNPKEAIHVSVDNNRLPYIAISLWQIDVYNKVLKQVGELPCSSPHNTASKAAQQLVGWLKARNYTDMVYMYGDPSANAKSTVDDEGRSFFDKFLSVVTTSGYRITNRIGKSAPGVSVRGAFLNEVLESNLYGWTIQIDRNCFKSIEDYLMVKEDKDGTMMKRRETDKETKQSFERYGHFSDVFAYFAVTVLKEEFIRYKSRGRRRPLSISN